MSKKKDEETPTIARPGLREKLLSKLAAESFGEEERDVPVVARMNKKVVHTLDSLVALGIFKSRSEAAAALVEAATGTSAAGAPAIPSAVVAAGSGARAVP